MSRLIIEELSKTYPNGAKALQNLHLEIGRGMFGLLGPNGAGKSTLMRTIATIQKPDSGRIEFDGIDVLADPLSLRKILGYLPQEFGVYPGVSAERLLRFVCDLKGVNGHENRAKMIQWVLELTNLSEVRFEAVSEFSGGMKRRFGIAQLLLNDPKLIIVDEPTAGLDPEERNRFLNLLRHISDDIVVLFSTHLVEDVAVLCNNMAIIDHGKVLAQTSPEKGVKSLEGKVWELLVSQAEAKVANGKMNIISSRVEVGQKSMIRLYSETSPGSHATLAKPKLEDFYFCHIHGFFH